MDAGLRGSSRTRLRVPSRGCCGNLGLAAGAVLGGRVCGVWGGRPLVRNGLGCHLSFCAGNPASSCPREKSLKLTRLPTLLADRGRNRGVLTPWRPLPCDAAEPEDWLNLSLFSGLCCSAPTSSFSCAGSSDLDLVVRATTRQRSIRPSSRQQRRRAGGARGAAAAGGVLPATCGDSRHGALLAPATLCRR